MSLVLVVHPELRAEALPLLAAMEGNGVAIDLSVGDAGGDPITQVERGGARLALVSVEAPGPLPTGVRWAAVPRRTEPRDILVPLGGTSATLRNLAEGTRVGVAGARRWSFLRAHRPDVEPVALVNGGGPGAALASGSVDVAILGAMEARRSMPGWHATEILDLREWVPGACQGAVALVAREDDVEARRAAACVEDPNARAALVAERSVVDALGARPNAPLGVLALAHGRMIRLWGMVASADGRSLVRSELAGSVNEPGRAGRALADLLLARGAGELLERSVR
jgi:hydroxymethylbilane synthase